MGELVVFYHQKTMSRPDKIFTAFRMWMSYVLGIFIGPGNEIKADRAKIMDAARSMFQDDASEVKAVPEDLWTMSLKSDCREALQVRVTVSKQVNHLLSGVYACSVRVNLVPLVVSLWTLAYGNIYDEAKHKGSLRDFCKLFQVCRNPCVITAPDDRTDEVKESIQTKVDNLFAKSNLANIPAHVYLKSDLSAATDYSAKIQALANAIKEVQEDKDLFEILVPCGQEAKRAKKLQE